jgi:hypothetical protein
MEAAPLTLVYFAIGFGCFYWTKNIVTAVGSLLGISMLLAGIVAVVTQGWGLVVILLYPHIWFPALIVGGALGWTVRWLFEPTVKEKSE